MKLAPYDLSGRCPRLPVTVCGLRELCSNHIYNSEVWCFFRMKVKSRGSTSLLVSFAAVCLVVFPGGRACPRRCACYVPTEVHCTFRYLTSIPHSLPHNVERINLGCAGALVLLPSQGGIDYPGDLSSKHLWLWEIKLNSFNNISLLKWVHEDLKLAGAIKIFFLVNFY